MKATLVVLDKLDCGLEYVFADAGVSALEKGKALLPEETEASIAKTQVAFKGPLTTPIGEGFTSLNVTLRKRFDLYANLRPAISYPGARRYDNVNIITIRENTEGMYAGERQEVMPDGERAESVSVITRAGAGRILRFAYETACKFGRKLDAWARGAQSGEKDPGSPGGERGPGWPGKEEVSMETPLWSGLLD